ncbi:hypothetical protein FB567DRAFT_613128 [Paraphoma chrysanthemicola]|uniref:Actin-like ATPase domain-containing protein n=1 Tax=Paraphoma chrysanthemicola TaxID=798071 RepID=A0A8K0QTK6_9PLEO|nr:hypothetical protein FB567DRAFT_613128 [Paraphoma chrysanthemicola]
MYPVSAPRSRQSTQLSALEVEKEPVNGASVPFGGFQRGNGQHPQEVSVDEFRETRLVIGIDFGTTYTGVAFATPLGSSCLLHEISVINDWGPDMKNHDKVPSVISYTNASEDFQQWGSSLSPDAVTMVRKKLELCHHSLQGELDLVVQVLEGMKNLNFEDLIQGSKERKLPVYACKTPEQIITDYLTKIFTYLDQTVDSFSESFRKYTKTDLVVTIPTDWPYEAVNSTYRSISKAGFNSVNFPRLNDPMFVAESEAAARYTVRYYKDTQGMEFLKDNSCFVLCDAGGGTVDVVSYKVISTHPTLQLKQIGRPTGKKCGSVFINENFKRWLRTQIGENNWRQLDPDLRMDKATSHESETPAMRELMDTFDDHKERFAAGESRDVRFDLPPPLDNLTAGNVRSGEVTIPRTCMESFFDACLDHIIPLIEDHMRAIERLVSGKAKNLFLVGGFGSSPYLRYYIQRSMEVYNIKFRTPDTSWTAVVQGAVVCGIDSAQISSVQRGRATKHSYGVCMNEVFQETNHAREDLIAGRNGQLYAESQLIWLINEGDVFFVDEPRKVSKLFDITFDKMQRYLDIPIYQHSTPSDENEEDRPERLNNAINDVSKATVLQLDLAKLRLFLGHDEGSVNRRESMYQGARTRNSTYQKLKEGVLFSVLQSRYHATLHLVLEQSSKSIRASVSLGDRRLATSQIM